MYYNLLHYLPDSTCPKKFIPQTSNLCFQDCYVILIVPKCVVNYHMSYIFEEFSQCDLIFSVCLWYLLAAWLETITKIEPLFPYVICQPYCLPNKTDQLSEKLFGRF